MRGLSVGHGGGARRRSAPPRKKDKAKEENVPVRTSKSVTPATRERPDPVKAFPDLKITKRTEKKIQTMPTPKTKKLQTKKPFKPKLPKKKFVRPSLSAQLNSIMSNTSDLTNEIRKMGGLEGKETPLLEISSRNFVVGKLTSKYPSMVQFYPDRCTYEFFTPYERKQISMEMFYRHMDGVKISSSQLQLQFKINHALIQFPKDYNPSLPSHKLSITFNSMVDVEKVRSRILPKILESNYR